MKIEKLSFQGSHEMQFTALICLPEEKPQKILQITHGMTEHIGRYTELAELLTRHGIAVAGFDLRGHGENPGDSEVAAWGEYGWEDSLEDMHFFHKVLSEMYPEVPHYMLGFSLGSFLLREYLHRYDDPIAGAIVMGTGHQPGLVLSVIMKMVQGEVKKTGCDNTTPMVQKLSFDTYNQKFKPNRTPSDWLCSDNEQLDAYIADPLSRSHISAGLFYQLLSAMRRTGHKDMYANWNPDMPVLLLSGQEDPVGDMGKGVVKVHKIMEKAGLTKVERMLVPDARHDLLHEVNSGAAESTRAKILEFIQR